MPKLVVLGCSVSDYTHVDKAWGEILSEKLEHEYIHEASGCGSNWRMWRKVFGLINNNIICNNDTVIVQYTETIRNEFWSPYQKKSRPLYGSKKTYLVEKYNDDGAIIKFKMDAHTFNDYTSAEKKFFKNYTRFISEDFELENFTMMHNMFQGFMKDKGFDNLYFVKAGGYGPVTNEEDFIDYYKQKFISIPDAFQNHLPKDHLHMNQTGHKKLADIVYNYIKS